MTKPEPTLPARLAAELVASVDAAREIAEMPDCPPKLIDAAEGLQKALENVRALADRISEVDVTSDQVWSAMAVAVALDDLLRERRQ